MYYLENIYLPICSIKDKVGAKLKLEFRIIHFAYPCKNFDKFYLLQLFTQLRIFTAITL